MIRFCGQDEEHDPGEEFEEWLACNVCGDNGKSIPSYDAEKHEKKKEQMQYKYICFRNPGSQALTDAFCSPPTMCSGERRARFRRRYVRLYKQQAPRLRLV